MNARHPEEVKDMENAVDLAALEKKAKQYRALLPRLSAFERADHEENFTVEFTHDSTSIEGNTLTLIQTKMILTDRITPAEISLKELDEVRAHGHTSRIALRVGFRFRSISSATFMNASYPCAASAVCIAISRCICAAHGMCRRIRRRFMARWEIMRMT